MTSSGDDADVGRWAVIVPVGPAAVETERLHDLFDALQTYEPGVGSVVLVDDAADQDRDLLATAGPLRGRTTVIVNPRGPDLEGWSDGLVVGIKAALELLLTGGDVDWVLKMDTDALVIGEFASAITERFATDPTLGLVGSHDLRCDGTPHPNGWPRTIRKHQHWISVWRPPNRLFRTSFTGIERARREFVRDARKLGYRPGEHCQGGAYAVSMRAVREIKERGWFDAGLWMGTQTAEDVVMGAEVRAAGFGIAGMVAPGEPFAVRYIGIEDAPDVLVAAGHGLVHSLKSHGDWTEAELRDAFRRIRGQRVGEGRPS